MNNIKILDCTLRDGGYINNWNFGEDKIKKIFRNLCSANIDIIECGFIRSGQYSKDSTVFSSMDQLKSMILPKNPKVQYAIMIEFHEHVEDLIPEYDGKGADIIRVTFRRKEWNGARDVIKSLIKKGYKVCVQPVGTASYDDKTLINLLNDVNKLNPYAFYLVDTLGMMYQHEMRRFFYLIDNNLSRNIFFGFHSHNNIQMSFSNAQELIGMSNQRNLIIDTSCYGMGRGVGNLATELLVDYINKNIDQKYYLTPILNIVDKYLMPIYAEQSWGYALPYFLSAIVKCHPNYASYLMKKETLDMESIEKILSFIPLDSKNEYDEHLVEKLYLTFQANEIDDTESVTKLQKKINQKDVVIIGPGISVYKYRSKINSLLDGKFSISVNFFSKIFNIDALFISNEKRLSGIKNSISGLYKISTSNISVENSVVFNYTGLLGEGDGSDNSGAMLIRILKKIGVKKIYIAGFDGFDVNASENFYISDYKSSLDYNSVQQKNYNISKQLRLALSGVDYEFITPTKYEISGL